MVGRCERQFRIMNGKTTAFEVEQPSGPAQIVQQMTVDMEKIGIIAKPRDDVLVPDLRQHGTAGACQGAPPCDLRRRTRPPVTVLHGLLFRYQPGPIKS
jgi:hypothetical protein